MPMRGHPLHLPTARNRRGRRRLQWLLLLGGAGSTSRSWAYESNPLVDTSLTDGNPNVVAKLAPSQDCVYLGWSTWSPCGSHITLDAPAGIRTRTRRVRSPEKGTAGKPCESPMFDAALCQTYGGSSSSMDRNARYTGAVGIGVENIDPTTLTPCSLAEWSSWSGCRSPADPSRAGTQSCGYSYETRSRQPLNGPCLLREKVRTAFLDCALNSGQAVIGCNSRVSDQGSILESRICPIGLCNTDCVVGSWTPFSSCSQTCGTGVQRRKRRVELTAGGSGARCPHLVESRNCHAAECDTDCQLGDFGAWGRCLPVATQAGSNLAAQPPSSGCARKRVRAVLVKRTGVGAPCAGLQEFQNCRCPLGGTLNNQTARSFPKWAQSVWNNATGFWQNVTGNILRRTNSTASGKTKSNQSTWTIIYISSAVLLCLTIACACACFWVRGKRRKRSLSKVTFAAGEEDDVLPGRGRHAQAGSRHLAAERDANEEGLSDDAPLLSERPEPQYASTKVKMQAAGKDWRHEAPLHSELLPPSAWPGGGYPASYASPDASRYYNSMPGRGVEGGYPSFNAPYRGRQADVSPYGDPYGGGSYRDPYGGGTLAELAPMPLLNPPPQYMPSQAGNYARPF